jgi:chemotaxis protein histidine kinase CheA
MLLHKIENNIKLLLDLKEIKWENMLDLAIQVRDIQEGIEELKERIKEIVRFQVNFNTTTNKGLLEKMLQRIITNESNNNNKIINLDCSKFDSQIIPEKHRKLLKDIFVQLVRNSIIHGIEKPEEREKLNKNPYGLITISLSKDEAGNMIYTFKDDGNGINTKFIKEKAKAKGLITEKDNFELSDAVKLIFNPGFSTAETITMTAGRGIGLSLIKTKINEAHGKIKIKTRQGEYCEYIITLP